jgi:methyltransferase (TIGR00027 family)
VKDSTPSATANVVARNIALVAATPRLSFLVAPEAADLTGLLIREYSRRGDSFLRRARSGWFQCLFHCYERCTIPGLALHQALRKRHIERVVRSSLAEGFEQVVVLGGGLDTLALRLHREFPGVNFLELDHPATQRLKREVVKSRRLGGPNLKLIPVDFGRQSLNDFLAASPDYLPGRRTVFLSEGVLMYLAPDEIESLFHVIRRQEGPGVRFVFTFMELDSQGRPAFRNSTWLVRLWLRLKKEPFRWGLPRGEIEDFVTARGFSLREVANEETFRQGQPDGDRLRREALAEGEIVCVAERGEVACSSRGEAKK